MADRAPGKPACVPVADALLSSGSIRTAVSCTGVLAVVACFCAEESSSDSERFDAGVDCVPVAAVVVVWEVNWRGPAVGVVIERGRNAAVIEVVEPDSDAVVFLDFFNDGFIEVAAGDGLLDLFSRFLASTRSWCVCLSSALSASFSALTTGTRNGDGVCGSEVLDGV